MGNLNLFDLVIVGGIHKVALGEDKFYEFNIPINDNN